ncbi:unnamed protein product [Acanthoscelides obtectus]|uniref:Uncharacterized protein n=1 Tax=Acanthoscelides obtectus TaxID=200917 RepID=A0A9P0JSF5_ACAOB|nr:unnamed protein product [Acanthoscelides obtectus]CAK1637492.1 Mitochondrial coenzyme A transporter SLC25A42 [Acanthoscelides obtectus]
MAKKHASNKKEDLTNAQIVITSLAAGAVAGAIAKTTIAPLDRTKINFQVNHKPYSTKKALKFLLHTLKKEGLFALWRGNSATMARIVPHAAIQFTAHEQWKKVLRVDQGGGESPGRLFLAGSLAGVTSQSLTYPLDLARARMAVTHKREYATLRQVRNTKRGVSFDRNHLFPNTFHHFTLKKNPFHFLSLGKIGLLIFAQNIFWVEDCHFF